MAYLPNTINEVAVEYSTTVNRTVEQRVVDALNLIIRRDVAAGHTLESIYISSAADSHSMPSRHAQSKAVDISRINGKKMAIYYGTDNAVTAIVDAIQNAFEAYPYARENFGPHLKNKLGSAYSVGGHGDHIHISVN